jgi:ATP-dependent exoDNAse (exonuclease V) alpha subunit
VPGRTRIDRDDGQVGVNTLLQILRAKTPAIALAAPTGRAAKRMSAATGLEARTLHRLLEADLLVVGEVSIRTPLPRSSRNRAILMLDQQKAPRRE